MKKLLYVCALLFIGLVECEDIWLATGKIKLYNPLDKSEILGTTTRGETFYNQFEYEYEGKKWYRVHGTIGDRCGTDPFDVSSEDKDFFEPICVKDNIKVPEDKTGFSRLFCPRIDVNEIIRLYDFPNYSSQFAVAHYREIYTKLACDYSYTLNVKWCRVKAQNGDFCGELFYTDKFDEYFVPCCPDFRSVFLLSSKSALPKPVSQTPAGIIDGDDGNVVGDAISGTEPVGADILLGITEPGKGSNEEPSMRATKQVSTSGLNSLQTAMAQIHNKYGKFLEERANALQVKVEDLAAVLKCESGGNGFNANGRMIIRHENHIFFQKYTNNRANAERVKTYNDHYKANGFSEHYFRATTSSSWELMHDFSKGDTQDLEWKVLKFSQSLDDTAALLSISMGAPQIMGFNYQVVGYSNVQQMFVAFSKSIKAQLDGLISFVQKNSPCLNSLRSSNYVGFARCYNGAGQDAYYGNLIKEAAAAYKVAVSR